MKEDSNKLPTEYPLSEFLSFYGRRLKSFSAVVLGNFVLIGFAYLFINSLWLGLILALFVVVVSGSLLSQLMTILWLLLKSGLLFFYTILSMFFGVSGKIFLSLINYIYGPVERIVFGQVIADWLFEYFEEKKTEVVKVKRIWKAFRLLVRYCGDFYRTTLEYRSSAGVREKDARL